MEILAELGAWLAQVAWPALKVDYYENGLRGSLFGGFLSIGGFLFSIKTFMLIKLKEGLYDLPEYRQEVMRRRVLHRRSSRSESDPKDEPRLRHYRPLAEVAWLLHYSVVASLLTAVAQVTVGLSRHWLAFGVAIGMAAITVTLLFASLFYIRRQVLDWFTMIDKQVERNPPEVPYQRRRRLAREAEE